LRFRGVIWPFLELNFRYKGKWERSRHTPSTVTKTNWEGGYDNNWELSPHNPPAIQTLYQTMKCMQNVHAMYTHIKRSVLQSHCRQSCLQVHSNKVLCKYSKTRSMYVDYIDM